tara:strand:- start:2859 stop:3845 length:987 start_codon:yes stop_codon:yes gene_type:complete
MKKNVAVLMGGYSSEHEISVLSGNTVFKNIDLNLYNPYKVIIDNDNWNLLDLKNKKFPIDKDTFNTSVDGNKINFDIAFIMIHGTPGEDGIIQKYFEKLQIPYTGPSSDVALLTFDKKKCTDFAKKNDIKTAKSELITKNSKILIDDIHKKLNFPLFVKANNSGSSYGISKVYNNKELSVAIKKSFQFDNEVLIEEFLNGKEVSVGVMNYKNEIKVFGITEIITNNDFFDYEAKYQGKHEEISPARLSKTQKTNVKNAAIKIYKKLNMSGFSRSDFIVIKDDPYLLEVNSIPGMTEESIFPKQVKMNGISLKELFTYMIENTLVKFKK